MKKICFVTTTPLTAQVFLSGPIERLSEKYEIHLITDLTSINENLPNVKKQYHINIYRNISLINDLKCLIEIVKILKANNYNAIHTITPKAGLLGLLGALISGNKIKNHTFTGQVWANKKGAYRLLLKNIDRLINKLATHSIVDGHSQREFLIKKNIVSEKAIVFGKGSISGIDLNKFKPKLQTKNKFRKKFKISEKEWVFMYLGRLNREKGVLDLLNAFNNLKEIANIRLVIVGPDEENITINHKKLFDNTKVLYIPFTKEPHNLIQICDVFCLPSYREGFGLSVIEASALEKGIICSDAYGLRDTILDKITGIKHKKGNIKDLREKLLFSINNKSKFYEMGINGRNYVKKNFSKESIVGSWNEFYESIL